MSHDARPGLSGGFYGESGMLTSKWTPKGSPYLIKVTITRFPFDRNEEWILFLARVHGLSVLYETLDRNSRQLRVDSPRRVLSG